MATKLGDLKIAVIVAGKDAKKQLREIGVATEDVEERTESYNRAAKQQGLSMRQLVGIGASLAGVYYTVVRPLNQIIDTTSDVNENLSKATVVFGDNMAQVKDWADTLSGQVNRSRFDLIKMASTVQDTFVPLGFARGEAADLSKQLTELAVDVASFNNAQDTDVMRDFQSALVGNHETVRKYGIVLTEAQLKQEALNSGIIDTERELTATEKVQARLNLIMAGSADAIGDAARTAEQYANVKKAAQAATKDLSVAIGTRLLPGLAQLRGAYAENVRIYERWLRVSPVEELKNQRIEFLALMRTLQRGNIPASERNRIIGELQQNYGDYIENVNLEKASYNDLETAINEANTAFKEQIRLKAFEQTQEKQRQKVADLTQQVVDLTLALEKDKQIRDELEKQGEVPLFQPGLLADPQAVEETIANLNDEIDTTVTNMNEARQRYEDAFGALDDGKEPTDDTTESMAQFNKTLEELLNRLHPAEKRQREYQASMMVLDTALEQGKITQEEYNQSVAKLKELYQDSADGANANEKAIKALLGTLYPAQKRQREYNQNLSILDDALEDGTLTQEKYNEAVARLKEIYESTGDAAGDSADAQLTHTQQLEAALGKLSNKERAALNITNRLNAAWTRATLNGQNGFEAMESAVKSLLATLAQNLIWFGLLNAFTGGLGMGFGQFLLGQFGGTAAIPGAAEGASVTQPTQMIVGEGKSVEIVAPQHRMEPMLEKWMMNVEQKSGLGDSKQMTMLLDEVRIMNRQLSRMQKDINVIQSKDGTYRVVQDKQSEILT